jgi:hypothetical protein
MILENKRGLFMVLIVLLYLSSRWCVVHIYLQNTPFRFHFAFSD